MSLLDPGKFVKAWLEEREGWAERRARMIDGASLEAASELDRRFLTALVEAALCEEETLRASKVIHDVVSDSERARGIRECRLRTGLADAESTRPVELPEGGGESSMGHRWREAAKPWIALGLLTIVILVFLLWPRGCVL